MSVSTGSCDPQYMGWSLTKGVALKMEAWSKDLFSLSEGEKVLTEALFREGRGMVKYLSHRGEKARAGGVEAAGHCLAGHDQLGVCQGSAVSAGVREPNSWLACQYSCSKYSCALLCLLIVE